jgi:hypothetical protein
LNVTTAVPVPAPLVAPSVTVKAPVADGVPDTTPEAVLSVRPGGSVPETSA